MKQSPPGKLAKHDVQTTAKDTLAIGIAVVITKCVEYFTGQDIGSDAATVVYVVAGMLAMLFRRFVTNTTQET